MERGEIFYVANELQQMYEMYTYTFLNTYFKKVLKNYIEVKFLKYLKKKKKWGFIFSAFDNNFSRWKHFKFVYQKITAG